MVFILICIRRNSHLKVYKNDLIWQNTNYIEWKLTLSSLCWIIHFFIYLICNNHNTIEFKGHEHYTMCLLIIQLI